MCQDLALNLLAHLPTVKRGSTAKLQLSPVAPQRHGHPVQEATTVQSF